MFDISVKKEIYNALVRIKEGEIKDRHSGICQSLGCILQPTVYNPHSVSVGFVIIYSQGWQHHSGNHVYPVPEQYAPSEEGEPPCGWDYWNGKEGELRYDLLNYLIDKLGNEISGEMFP